MVCPADCSGRGECEHGFCWCERAPLLLLPPLPRPAHFSLASVFPFRLSRRCHEGYYGNDCGQITAAKWASLTGEGGKGRPLPSGARAALPIAPAPTTWPEGTQSSSEGASGTELPNGSSPPLAVASEELAASGAGGGLRGEVAAKWRRRPLIYVYELPKQYNIQVDAFLMLATG